MSRVKPYLAPGFVALVVLPPSVADAQTLEIAPTTVDLAVGRLASTVRIVNRGDQPTTIQVRPYAWTQTRDQEKTDATSDLLISPPFATIAPGESQTIRVVLRKPARDHEDAYRLIVDQLPPAAAPGSVRVALRISLPVFAQASDAAKPDLSWSVTPTALGTGGTLVIRNNGQRHARISDLKFATPSVAVPDFTFKYVLAGTEVALPLTSTAPLRTALHASAASDEGRIEADAPVADAP